jgi:hypothetical protein
MLGNNEVPQSAQSSKIAMTRPVKLVPDIQPLKLVISAPVSLQPAADDSPFITKPLR